MTIPEAAKELNVTPQAIYNKLKRARIPLNSVKQSADSDQLTQDGINWIFKAFNKQRLIMIEKTEESQEESIKQQNKQLSQENETLLNEQERLKKQIDSLEKDKEYLQKQNESLTKQIETLTKLLEKEQETNRQLLLPAPAEDQQPGQQRKKKHWWQRGE